MYQHLTVVLNRSVVGARPHRIVGSLIGMETGLVGYSTEFVEFGQLAVVRRLWRFSCARFVVGGLRGGLCKLSSARCFKEIKYGFPANRVSDPPHDRSRTVVVASRRRARHEF